MKGKTKRLMREGCGRGMDVRGMWQRDGCERDVAEGSGRGMDVADGWMCEICSGSPCGISTVTEARESPSASQCQELHTSTALYSVTPTNGPCNMFLRT